MIHKRKRQRERAIEWIYFACELRKVSLAERLVGELAQQLDSLGPDHVDGRVHGRHVAHEHAAVFGKVFAQPFHVARLLHHWTYDHEALHCRRHSDLLFVFKIVKEFEIQAEKNLPQDRINQSISLLVGFDLNNRTVVLVAAFVVLHARMDHVTNGTIDIV